MDFVTLEEDDFTYGVVADVAPNVRRVIAENPSKFTYRGTGTYVIGRGDVAVIDPGPQLDAHRDALAAALDGDTVRAILVTHCHADHSPLAAWLSAETGAPTIAFGSHGAATDEWDIGSLPDDFGRAPEPDSTEPDESDELDEPKMEESTDTDFTPDRAVMTGETVFEAGALRMAGVHTPGHTSNHMCFTLDDGDSRMLFTGDHVMGWSTTVVSPPDGDMSDYIESLRMVAGLDLDVAIPTHGSPITNPREFVNGLVDHRLERERQVLDAIRRGLLTIPEMVTELYAAVRVELHRPAGNSVLGHIVKLIDDGLVAVDDNAENGGAGDGRPRLDSTYVAV
jgi:glyoxylase-like metal-dependent hydrolase (beta-lactamase superfamily II)